MLDTCPILFYCGLKTGEVESGIRTAYTTTQICTQILRARAGDLKRCGWTRVPALGWKDPLEKGTETHSSSLAWRIHPIDRVTWQAIIHRVTKDLHSLTHTHTHTV